MNHSIPPPSNSPLADFDQLQAACDGNIEVIRELLVLYFRQADEIAAGLADAIEKGAADDVNHLAHKLAGSSLACGMSAVVSPIRSLEINAKEGRLDGAAALLTQVQVQLKSLHIVVEDYLRGLPAS